MRGVREGRRRGKVIGEGSEGGGGVGGRENVISVTYRKHVCVPV